MEEENKNIELPVFSLILTVGPSGCGKTTFVKNKLIPHLKGDMNDIQGKNDKGPTPNIQYVSSDDIRRELLGDPDIHKYDKRMGPVSANAFDLLKEKVRKSVSYPVNAHYVIVDSTAISSNFRNEMFEIAKNNGYYFSSFVFNYDREDLMGLIEENEDPDHIDTGRRVATRQNRNFVEYELKKIAKKDHDVLVRFKHLDEEVNIRTKNFDELCKMYLDQDVSDYVIVGDVHGCYNELIELLEKNGAVINNDEISFPEEPDKKVLLLGDICDKGPDTEKVIEFVHKNMNNGKLLTLIGNHENFVYKWLQGNIDKKTFSNEFLNTYFDSVFLLGENEELKGKFMEIVDRSMPFYFNEDMVLTHVPVSNTKLGKNTKYCYKDHYKMRLPNKGEFNDEDGYLKAMAEKVVKPVMDDAVYNFPYHIFGHKVSDGISFYKNKINIDTGCYKGGRLTSISINPGGKNFVQSVPSHYEKDLVKEDGERPFFSMRPERNIDINELESRDRGRIYTLAENGVNFISGTMCPSDKDEENNDIESLEKALTYYRNQGEEQVIMQPKYMGSRCNVYLHKNKEDSYMVTRRGFVIDFIDTEPVLDQLYENKELNKMFEGGAELIIIDAELMPWKAIGEGLIDKSFVTIEKAVSSEIDLLRENGFEEKLDELRKDYKESGFQEKSEELKKKELAKEFGSHKTKIFHAFKEYDKKFIPLDERKEGVDTFKEQLDIFAGDDELHIKPFSILKTIYGDGSEKTYFDHRNEELFTMVSDDTYCIVDLNDMDRAVKTAHEFYNGLVNDKKMEGVVIKPDKVYNSGEAPFLKVRNKDYLTIVYGHDYKSPDKYGKLIKRKRIKGKLNASIKEFNIGKRLLEIPHNEISKENDEYIQLLAKMITEEKQEEELDPRL